MVFFKRKRQLQKLENKIEQIYAMIKGYIDYKEHLSEDLCNNTFHAYTGHGVAALLWEKRRRELHNCDHSFEYCLGYKNTDKCNHKDENKM